MKRTLSCLVLMTSATLFAQQQGPSGYGPSAYGPAPQGQQGAPQSQAAPAPYASGQYQGQATQVPMQQPMQQGQQQMPMQQQPANMQAPPVPQGDLTLPAGTLIVVRTNQGISTEHAQVGDGFSVSLQQPLVANGFVVAQRGQTLLGRITMVERAGRIKGTSKLGVELGQMTFVDGAQMPIKTELLEQRGDTSYGRDAAGIITTTGVGAAIGANVNGGVGAGVGAAAGLVASVAGVMLTRGRDTVLYPETSLTFRTKEPITVSTSRSAQAFQPITPQDYQQAATYDRHQLRPVGYGYPGPRSYYGGAGYPYGYYPVDPYYAFYPGYGYGYGYWAGPVFHFRGGYGGHYRR